MGDVKKMIECCVVMDFLKGYMVVRKLFWECFGYLYMIVVKFVGEIIEGF